MFRGQAGDLLTALRDLQFTRPGQPALAVHDRDLIFLQQVGDAAGKFLRNLAGARDDLFQIETGLLDRQAVLGRMRHIAVDFRRAQQRLGRNTAPVEADAAQMLALHHGHLEAKLRRADGGDVTAGSATDNDNVEIAIGHRFSLSRAAVTAAWREDFRSAA